MNENYVQGMIVMFLESVAEVQCILTDRLKTLATEFEIPLQLFKDCSMHHRSLHKVKGCTQITGTKTYIVQLRQQQKINNRLHKNGNKYICNSCKWSGKTVKVD